MADVFISYAREDRERVGRIAQALEMRGVTVWFDDELLAGEAYSRRIQDELERAQCVLVVWSKRSVESRWVLDEARFALESSRVVPVFIDAVQMPIGFRRLQGIELSDWNGDPQDPRARTLIDSVLHIVGGERAAIVANRRANVRDAYGERVKSTPVRRVREGKVLLVGNGGAGKTSLARHIFAAWGRKGLSQAFERPFAPNEPQTQGVEIGRVDCKTPDGDLRLNVWDFGGQEIMHSTHQFFLTERSLYVLVLDGRREEDPEYWLDMIKTFGGASRVLVVMNKIDENPFFDLNRNHLQSKYPAIAGFYRVSCKTGEGVEPTLSSLQSRAMEIEHLSRDLPEPWFKIKRRMESIREDFISFDRFESTCAEAGVDDPDEVESVATYLSDLGVIVHFDAPVLRETKVLNPSWVTQGVYAIVTSARLRGQGGAFHRNDLAHILDRKRFPRARHDYLIEIMRRFDLCFPLDDGRYLAPDLLPAEEPEHGFNLSDGIRHRVAYEFMPTSVFPRTMVRLNYDLAPGGAWRDGCVLRHEASSAQALIRADRKSRAVTVNVTGPGRADYFPVVRNAILQVSANPTPLLYRELVPCVCSQCAGAPEPHYYRYDYLQQRRHKGRTDVDCERSIEAVPLDALLSGIDAVQKSPGWDVFVSYSQRDTATVSRVVGDLRERNLDVWWDVEQIDPGDAISMKIELGLRKSRFVMPCISRNQVQSGWCRIEYTAILNRIIRKMTDTQLAPLIIDDIDLDDIPVVFSDIQWVRLSESQRYAQLLSFITARS